MDHSSPRGVQAMSGKKRSWFQIHLSTAVLLMFVAAMQMGWHFAHPIQYGALYHGNIEFASRAFAGCVLLFLIALLWEAQLRRSDHLGRIRATIETIKDFTSVASLIISVIAGGIVAMLVFRLVLKSDKPPERIQGIIFMALIIIGQAGGFLLSIRFFRWLDARRRRDPNTL